MRSRTVLYFRENGKKVLYNDIDPLLPVLILDAINGKYNFDNFTPEWIDRETFLQKRETDGFVKYGWSFSNNGIDYIYGKNIEETKHAGHEWVLHGTPIPGLEDLQCDLPCEPKYCHERRNVLRIYVKEKCNKRLELQHLEYLKRLQVLEHLIRLERLQHLERLERVQHLERLERVQHLDGLERLGKLEMTCMDYREYKYQDGDVVYCDIPYPNGIDTRPSKNYQTEFDHGAFYQWAISRPYPVYFSSYKLGGIVWEGDKNVTKAGYGNSLVRREVLYCVDNDFETPKKYYQGWLFV